MTSLTRRSAAVLAAAALAVVTLAPSGPAAADPTPAGGSARTWLAGELTAGLIHYPDFGGYDDFGLSIDAGLAALSTGDTAVAGQIRDALAARINDYITGEAFGDSGSTYAGPTAKALVFAHASGGSPTSFGGVDLVRRLESVTASDGRIADVSQFGDNANTIGLSYAARGLTSAASAKAAAVTSYLLRQQCPAGFFRLTLGAQQCASDASPDTDVTALAVLNLQDQRSRPDVEPALARAVVWLAATQAADGSFGGGAVTAAANTNSTGLAGHALGLSCDLARAGRAAAYVRGFQVPAGQAGPLAAEVGAVAYDTPGLNRGRADGITASSTDQWRRATAQATLALGWDPAATPTVEVVAPRFAKAGDRTEVEVGGVAAGERVCVTVDGVTQALTGSGAPLVIPVDVARHAQAVAVSATTGPGLASAATAVLERKTLRVRAHEVVARGDRQRLLVRGLAAKEKVKVFFEGKVVAKGRANRKGRFVGAFAVSAEVGRHPARVTGTFKNRRRVVTFDVVR